MKIRTIAAGAVAAASLVVLSAAPASAAHARGDQTVALNGANENPTAQAPNAGDRNGSGKIDLAFFAPGPSTSTTVAFPGQYYVCYDLVTRNIGEIEGAHIHEVDREGNARTNPRKLNGPVVVNLLPTETNAVVFKDASGNVTQDEEDAATTCVADADIEDIIEGDASEYYVNIHTDEFRDGAIRGQLHAFS